MGGKKAPQPLPAFDELSELSLSAPAEKLNQRGVKAHPGDKWHVMQVVRVRKRLKATQRHSIVPSAVRPACGEDRQI